MTQINIEYSSAMREKKCWDSVLQNNKENGFWEGMAFQLRSAVCSGPECQVEGEKR